MEVDVIGRRVHPDVHGVAVFDQDLAFLRGQEERLQAYKADGHGGAWRDEDVVPSSADRFVVNYRKKLDGLAATMPWRTAPAPLAPLPRRELLDRYEQHTKGCAVCSSALAETRALAKAAPEFYAPTHVYHVPSIATLLATWLKGKREKFDFACRKRLVARARDRAVELSVAHVAPAKH